MDSVRKASLFSWFLLGLFLIFLGALAGDFVFYTAGALMLAAATVCSFLAKSSEISLIALLILISLSLRYIPIVRFRQPLYEDPVFDMATAREFQKNGIVGVLPDAPVRNLREYSGFPLVHVLAISISAATGLSLFDVFTYFPPLLDVASILFIYLLARRIFGKPKIAALSALIYATFSLNMLWLGTQIIRQSMAYPLALMAIYLFIRGSKTDKKMLGLSLFSFGVLPVAHHLTSMEIFYILGFTLVLAAFLKRGRNTHVLFWRRTKEAEIPTREDRFSFPLTLWLFLGISMFLYWITYARDVILPLFSARFLTILFSIISMREAGGLPTYVGSVTQSMNVFNVLSYARLLFLLVTSLCGLLLLTRERNRYKTFLYGFFLAPLPLLFVDIFIQHLTDMRHALFLLIPVFLLTAATVSRFDKDRLSRKIVFAVCLLIIIVPAPFMLFATLDPAPTYVYDRNSPFRFDLPQKRAFRNEFVLSGTSFIAQHANGTLIADYYATFGLFFYYDPYKVLPFGRVIITHAQNTTPQDIVVIDMEIYNERYMPLFLRHNLTIVVEDINNLESTANCIYSNGELVSWKIQLPSTAHEKGGK